VAQRLLDYDTCLKMAKSVILEYSIAAGQLLEDAEYGTQDRTGRA
jgi:hypothetical protein